MRRVVTLLALWLAMPAVAFAHPEVERARQLVIDGEYEAARPALDAALARDDLDRDDLIALLEVRALLFHGLAEEDALVRTLRSLASVDPTHRFGPRFPPGLAQRSVEIGREMGGRLRVISAQRPSAVGVRLDARVESDGEGLVRALRYRVFDASSGQWQPAHPPVEAAAGREMLVIVEAIGPGGAVIAGAGSSDAPIHLRGPGPLLQPGGPEGADLSGAESEPGDGLPEWAVIVIAVGAALVAGGVAIGVSVWAVENPMITFRPSTPTETP